MANAVNLGLTIHYSVLPKSTGQAIATHLEKFFMKGFTAATLIHADLNRCTENWQLQEDGTFLFTYPEEDIRSIRKLSHRMTPHDLDMLKYELVQYFFHIVHGSIDTIAASISVHHI